MSTKPSIRCPHCGGTLELVEEYTVYTYAQIDPETGDIGVTSPLIDLDEGDYLADCRFVQCSRCLEPLSRYRMVEGSDVCRIELVEPAEKEGP